MTSHVGDVKGLVLLDKDGKRIIAKYYKPEERLTNPRAQKIFEKKLFLRSNKYSTSKNLETEIMQLDEFVVVYRCFSDLNIYIFGSEDDNELIFAELLNVLVECLGIVFKHSFGRESVIQYMSEVILIVDELIEDGLILSLEAEEVLRRIKYYEGEKVQTEAMSFMDAFKSAKDQFAKSFF